MGNALPFVDLGTGRTATALSAGNETTCAILDDGSVKCWGNGALTGQPSSADVGDLPGQMGDALPALDLGGHKALHVALSATDGCAVLDDGSADCWGAHAPARVPTQVPFVATSAVRKLMPAGWGFVAVQDDGQIDGLLGVVAPPEWSQGVAEIGAFGSGTNIDGVPSPAGVWIIGTDGRFETWGDGNGVFVNGADYDGLDTPTDPPAVAFAAGAFPCLVFESGPPRCTNTPIDPTCTPDWCQDETPTNPVYFHLELGHSVSAIAETPYGHSCFLLSNGGVRCLGAFPGDFDPDPALGSSFDLIDTNGQYSWGPFHDIDLGTGP
jgi:hypothetical protein